MFNMVSQPTITESMVELADFAVESADSTTDSAADPVKIGLWVWALSNVTNPQQPSCDDLPLCSDVTDYSSPTSATSW